VKTKKGKSMSKSEQAVVVTTAHRGVFFGYATDVSGDVIKLRAARLCVYWSPAMRGFMGLAEKGPDAACKIGPPADIELRAITSVVKCSDEAVKRWEDGLWAR